MNEHPVKIIKLVHISGPLKGKIQHWNKNQISFGRHPDCDVVFPKDLTVVSRKHATIVREGNRFKIIDRSTNGTFVNGKLVKERYLRNGDVITFAQGGPKLSFLVNNTNNMLSDIPDIHEQETIHLGSGTVYANSVAPEASSIRPKSGATSSDLQAVSKLEGLEKHGSDEKVPMSVIIQFGPSIRSFDLLPVTIGTDPSSDFVIKDSTSSLPQDIKVEISAKDGQYVLKNLSGRSVVTINGRMLTHQAMLSLHDVIEIGSPDIRLEYLGKGRFAEVIATTAEGNDSNSGSNQNITANSNPKLRSKKRSMFHKIFKS